MEKRLSEVLKRRSGRSATVPLSSHISGRVGTLADRLSIIRDGVVESAR